MEKLLLLMQMYETIKEISAWVFALALLAFLVSGGIHILTQIQKVEEGLDESEEKMAKIYARWFKKSSIAFSISLVMFSVTNNDKVFYSYIGYKCSQELKTSDALPEILQKVIKVLNKKLDKELTDK